MDLTGLEEDRFQPELLPSYIDRIAQSNPSRTWVVKPKTSSDLSRGFEDIAYSTAANAINRAAWFFEASLGKPQPGHFPVVAYMGKADLRYYLLPIALVKVGYQIMLLSDVSSLDMQQYLISESGCQIIASPASHRNDRLLESTAARLLVVPELEVLLDPDRVTTYPYTKTLRQGLNDPLIMLHTSGTSSTTGRPKLIRYVLGTVNCASRLQHLPELNGHATRSAKLAEMKRMHTAYRISHAGGNIIAMSHMFSDNTAIVLSGDDPLSVDNLSAVLEHADIDSILTPPLLLERAVRQPEVFNKMCKLKIIIYGGGRLPAHVGDAISTRVPLYSAYASTEYINIPQRLSDPEDWQYVHFDPVYSGISWVRHPPNDPTSNKFEPVVIRNPDPAIQRYSSVFWNFPEATEWPMGDLFEPHPTKADHWKSLGRKDDMIVLSNGVNFMPTFFEQEILQRDPRIVKAVLYGDGEAHLAVLIELATPVDGTRAVAQIKEELWPLIEKCNQRTTKATQIRRNAVIIADEQRPLPKGAKGDVQRKIAEKLYQQELNEAFGRCL